MDRAGIERLVRRWTQEGIAEGRLEVFDEPVAEDGVDRSGPSPGRGVASSKARARAVRASFSEIQLAVDDLVRGR
jgi:hypothetical protein